MPPILRKFAGSMVTRRALFRVAVALGLVLDDKHRAQAAGRRESDLMTGRSQTTGEAQIFYNAGLLTEPKTFDWNLHPDCQAEPETFAGLLTLDANLNAVGDWAGSWDVNEDASLYTFYLRQFNKGWSDGHPVTAHDFVWSWRRQLDPDNGAQHAEMLYAIKYAEQIHRRTAVADENDPLHGTIPTVDKLGVVAQDDWTLEVTLAGPRAYFPQMLACQATVPAPRWQVEKYGDAWALGGVVPIVSNGPLKVDRWDRGAKIELSRNEGYWNVNSLRLANVVDPIVAADQTASVYKTGAGGQHLDWTTLSPEEFERFSADPTLTKQVQPYITAGIWMLVPQVTIAPFDRLEVRQALSHAIDRNRLVTSAAAMVTPAMSMVPPGMFGYLDEPSLQELQAFDPDKARSLLQGTPYAGGKNWPELPLFLRQDDEATGGDAMAKEIIAQLAEHLGLTVKVQAIPDPDFSQQLAQNTWPLILSRWLFAYPDPNNGYGDLFYSRKSTPKRQTWSNPDFDDLIEQAWAEPDQSKRLVLYLEAERLVQTDVGYLPLAYPLVQHAFKPWVRGVAVNAGGYAVPDGPFYRRMLTQVYIEGRDT